MSGRRRTARARRDAPAADHRRGGDRAPGAARPVPGAARLPHGRLARCSGIGVVHRPRLPQPRHRSSTRTRWSTCRRATAAASSSRATRTASERCVACYLCAVACPVDCIALQATAGRARPPLPGVVPHQLLALHLLRLLRGGVPHLRHPAHARRGDERVRAPQHGLREGGPADRRARASTTTTTSTASPASPSAARTRARPSARPRRPTSATCCREMTILFYIAAAVAVRRHDPA